MLCILLYFLQKLAVLIFKLEDLVLRFFELLLFDTKLLFKLLDLVLVVLEDLVELTAHGLFLLVNVICPLAELELLYI